jgi:hypothetical protein
VDEATRRARREEWQEQRRAQIRRRRAIGVAALVGVILLLVLAISSLAGGGGGGEEERAAAERKPPELPRGGRSIFPEFRVVGFAGAPQAEELGELGIGSPDSAARRLERQARPYGQGRGRPPILPAFELIAVIANATPGDDGKYRSRQKKGVIRRYLEAARRAKAILILDVQPGHAKFLDEVRELDEFLAEPDVSLALDPEWHMPEGQVPGQEIGSVTAHEVNEVSKHLSGIVQRNRLPEKLLLVHQFTSDMIENRKQLREYPGVALTLNVDGFGTPQLKRKKYHELVRGDDPGYQGFKLFYREDTGLMSPTQVLRLRPQPSFVVYE